MNKCEWKEILLTKDKYEWEQVTSRDSLSLKYREKPPEPIIKKSGETYVARFDGVDYLNMRDFNEYATNEKVSIDFMSHRANKTYWKPFSEIEITDEIAKLRPMVVASIKDMEGIIVRLFGMCRCSTDLAICERADAKTTDLFYDASVRLATVEDL